MLDNYRDIKIINNFGPYQFPEKLIPKTIIRASMDMKILIYDSSRNIRDWIYVLDHCKALDIVMNKGESEERYIMFHLVMSLRI